MSAILRLQGAGTDATLCGLGDADWADQGWGRAMTEARTRRNRSPARAGRWACVAAALALAGPAGAEGEPLGLRGARYLEDLPTLVAETEGLFAEAGLPLSVSHGGSGKANLAALRAGEIAFAVTAMTPFVIDLLADATPGGEEDPVILATLAHGTAVNHVVSLTRAPDAAGLAGARIGLARGTNSEYLWTRLARSMGLAPGAVTLVDLAPGRIADALAGGRIDAAVTWEPWTSALRAAHPDRLRTRDAGAAYTARWMLVARRETVSARPAAVRAVLGAYDRAIARIHAAPEAARARFRAKWGLPEAAPRPMGQRIVFDLRLDWALYGPFRTQVAWARAAGYPAAGPDPAFLSIYAGGPLAAIRPEAVTLPLGTASAQ